MIHPEGRKVEKKDRDREGVKQGENQRQLWGLMLLVQMVPTDPGQSGSPTGTRREEWGPFQSLRT